MVLHFAHLYHFDFGQSKLAGLNGQPAGINSQIESGRVATLFPSKLLPIIIFVHSAYNRECFILRKQFMTNIASYPQWGFFIKKTLYSSIGGVIVSISFIFAWYSRNISFDSWFLRCRLGLAMRICFISAYKCIHIIISAYPHENT